MGTLYADFKRKKRVSQLRYWVSRILAKIIPFWGKTSHRNHSVQLAHEVINERCSISLNQYAGQNYFQIDTLQGSMSFTESDLHEVLDLASSLDTQIPEKVAVEITTTITEHVVQADFKNKTFPKTEVRETVWQKPKFQRQKTTTSSQAFSILTLTDAEETQVVIEIMSYDYGRYAIYLFPQTVQKIKQILPMMFRKKHAIVPLSSKKAFVEKKDDYA